MDIDTIVIMYIRAIIKTFILFIPIILLSKYITPLKIIFRFKTLLFASVNLLIQSITTKRFNPNKIPYIGTIFIYTDYIILQSISCFEKYTKN